MNLKSFSIFLDQKLKEKIFIMAGYSFNYLDRYLTK
jgi:hypothetical protein